MADVTRLAMFLITLHVIFFYAGQAGIRAEKTGDNPHQKFVGNASSSEFRNATQIDSDGGFLSDITSLGLMAVDGISVLGDIVMAPYSVFNDTALPEFYKDLGHALLFFLEAMTILIFIRSGS